MTPIMAHSPSSLRTRLADAFMSNQFDIAGLADFHNALPLDEGLTHVYQWATTSGDLTNPGHFAELMYVLLHVARESYAKDGVSKFWPFLECNIEEAFIRIGKPDDQIQLSPNDRDQIGCWFEEGLHRFRYAVPYKSGSHYHINNILHHCGVPCSSVPGLIRLIFDLVTNHGESAVDLDPKTIADLVPDECTYLHKNVSRLLVSGRRGVSHMWAALARVVHAWSNDFDFDKALLVLPAALGREAVQASLINLQKVVQTTPLKFRSQLPPRLRYDPGTGSVRLWLQAGGASDWEITTRKVRAIWDSTAKSRTAHCPYPLPPDFEVSRPSFGRRLKIQTQPTKFPGLWFNGNTGFLEDGRNIDNDGLEPGCWYLLIKGKPKGFDPSSRLLIDWPNYGGTEWTAWEVEIPERAENRPSWTINLPDRSCSIELAHRPKPRVSLPPPVARARLKTGELIPIYQTAPIIQAGPARDLQLVQIRQMRPRLETQDLDIPAGAKSQLAASKPGVYFLRQRGGVGHILARFAVIPDLKIDPAIYADGYQMATLRLSCASSLGTWNGGHSIMEIGPGSWEVLSNTKEPRLEVIWQWEDPLDGDLTFEWSILGLRWRLLTNEGNSGPWTQQPTRIGKNESAETDAKIELQTPDASQVQVNGQTVTMLEMTSKGCRGEIKLMPFHSAEWVTVRWRETQRLAVVKTQRPILASLTAISNGETLNARWEQVLPDEFRLILLAWNPLKPGEIPKTFSLTYEEFSAGNWWGNWKHLGGGPHVSVTLAIIEYKVFGEVRTVSTARWAHAVEQPAAVLIHQTPNVKWSASNILLEIAHEITSAIHSELALGPEPFIYKLNYEAKRNHLPLEEIRNFAEQLPDRAKETRDSLIQWVALQKSTLPPFARPSPPKREQSLVQPTITAEGRERSQNDQAMDRLLMYRKDLWWLGLSYSDSLKYYLDLNPLAQPTDHSENCRQSAMRVIQFHKEMQLPWPGIALPWRLGEAMIHTHSHVRLPRLRWTEVYGEDNQVEAQFLAELGLEDLAIDAVAIGGSPNSIFTLTWEPNLQEWVIEIGSICIGRIKPDQVAVRQWQLEEICQQLNLGATLTIWGTNGGAQSMLEGSYNSDFWDKIDECLFRHPKVGPIHRSLIKKVRPREVKLWGYSVPWGSKDCLETEPMKAWRLAWMNRLMEGSFPYKTFRHGTLLPRESAHFLAAFNEAVAKWPDLMVRALGLVEFVSWMLFQGGLGFAAKWQCTHSDTQRG